MMLPLRQGTAINLLVGPFVDEVDGYTLENALSIVQADVRLSKANGAFAQKSSATAASFLENGYYSVPLNGTDLATAGSWKLVIKKAGARIVVVDAFVFDLDLYDTFITQGGLSDYIKQSVLLATIADYQGQETLGELLNLIPVAKLNDLIVSAAGSVNPNWAGIENPTSVANLSNTSIKDFSGELEFELDGGVVVDELSEAAVSQVAEASSSVPQNLDIRIEETRNA